MWIETEYFNSSVAKRDAPRAARLVLRAKTRYKPPGCA
jgi:hypothetical protein